MPLHHYLPATFLACFSADQQTLPRRDRVIFVGDKQRGSIFRAPASKCAAQHDFYRLDSPAYPSPEHLDAMWGGFERELAEAIAALIAGNVTSRVWTRVLVPFVTSVLVRSVDFEQRHSARIAGFPDVPLPSDNSNQARFMEMQRLLASVLAAEWRVFEAEGPGSLILSDLGFSPSGDVDRSLGVAIPLGPRHVLRVHPRQTRAILRYDGAEWLPLIHHSPLNPGSHLNLAKNMAIGADRFIFGPDEQSVRVQLDESIRLSALKGNEERMWQLWEPTLYGFMDSVRARVHEFTWHRLISMLESEEPKAPLFYHIDFAVLSRGWAPQIALPANLPPFAPALAIIGREVLVHLYDVTRDEVQKAAEEFAEELETSQSQAK